MSFLFDIGRFGLKFIYLHLHRSLRGLKQLEGVGKQISTVAFFNLCFCSFLGSLSKISGKK